MTRGAGCDTKRTFLGVGMQGLKMTIKHHTGAICAALVLATAPALSA